MTLNLVIVSPKNVYQCSDFRLLYRSGTITDHEAQKIVPVATYNWNALVQFTGVAKTDKFDTSQWLAGLSSQVEMTAPLKWLKDKLLETGKYIGSEPHTFSVTGFEGESPFVFLVSNFEVIDDTRVSVIPGLKKILEINIECWPAWCFRHWLRRDTH